MIVVGAGNGGMVAADAIAGRESGTVRPDFSAYIEDEKRALSKLYGTKSSFPAEYIRGMAAETLSGDLGIVRDEKTLTKGMEDIDYYLSIAGKISYDSSVMMYSIYSLTGILSLARAVLVCALGRRESRGSHYRSDHPETLPEMGYPTIISYDGGRYAARLDREGYYES